MKEKINDSDYEEICPTAIVTAHHRIFYQYSLRKGNLYKNLVLKIETRYKLTNKLLEVLYYFYSLVSTANFWTTSVKLLFY